MNIDEHQFKLLLIGGVWAVISYVVGLGVLNDIPRGQPVTVSHTPGLCRSEAKSPDEGSCTYMRQGIGWPTPAGTIRTSISKNANGEVIETHTLKHYGNWSNAGKNSSSTNNAIIMFAPLPIIYGMYYVSQNVARPKR